MPASHQSHCIARAYRRRNDHIDDLAHLHPKLDRFAGHGMFQPPLWCTSRRSALRRHLPKGDHRLVQHAIVDRGLVPAMRNRLLRSGFPVRCARALGQVAEGNALVIVNSPTSSAARPKRRWNSTTKLDRVPLFRWRNDRLLPTGVLTESGHTLRETWGRVHWAAGESSAVTGRLADGVIRSGERAAAKVTSAETAALGN